MTEVDQEYDCSEESEEESSDRSSMDTEFTDNLHSSEDDDYPAQFSEEEYDEQPLVRQRTYNNNNFILPTRRILKEDSQTYPPERWPPILDFLFVFSSFVAAVVAAYFTIF